MKPLAIAVAAISTLLLLAASAQAAVPTRLSLTAPSSVGLGEEILLGARLTTTDGQPVVGVRLELRQVGAVGERIMAQAETDAEGRVSFAHREYSIPVITLQVAFQGSMSFTAARAEARVEITGIEPEPAVVMSHTPGPLVKGILFSVLATVWLTYLYAASRVARLAFDRDGRSARSRRSLEGGRAR